MAKPTARVQNRYNRQSGHCAWHLRRHFE